MPDRGRRAGRGAVRPARPTERPAARVPDPGVEVGRRAGDLRGRQPGEGPGPAPILPTEPPPDLRPYLKVVDVAFAIDTTASMQSTIEAARQLAERPGGVGLAAVRRRQAPVRAGGVSRRRPAITGSRPGRSPRSPAPRGSSPSLNRTNAATRGDGSVDESVLDGVALALPPGPGDPPGEHVDWPTGRAGELATKLLVLLGDAPDHARDLDRAEGPGGAGQGVGDHDRDGRDRPARDALARRAGPLPRPVADAGRGVVSPARQGDRLRRRRSPRSRPRSRRATGSPSGSRR